MAERLRFSASAAYRHLRKVDPVIGQLIEEKGPYTPRPSTAPYASSVRTILLQQLAGAAASAIQRRLYALHRAKGRTPEPRELLEVTDEAYRAVGVSRQKAGYLRDLAQHVVEGALDFEHIDK